ncbi:DNA-formamidopyrimidine glycosylase family protein [Pedobacter sp. SYSU D00535]|uniref:DNA-formamidopyrimidine glycosylase family protein n=1 Tax=Pedobacter sp. SYSU D00535 TaxID=2810308 RepID=UPI001A979986|nr:DNA-formamidopyrimidine glycosylase family protein [Pedobacter sp. SYSU D00535]
MPEGPQIVYLKEQTNQFIGQELISIEGSVIASNEKNLAGQSLIDIKTFGKEILFCFTRVTIRVHLMLFGRYAIDGEMNRKLTLELEFENGRINFYASSCRLIEAPVETIYDWSVDVMSASFDERRAVIKLQGKPQQFICDALLDQNILAGVGNKIKNEVLFRRQVHPLSKVKDVPEAKLRELVKECVTVSKQYFQWKRDALDEEKWLVYKKTTCPRDGVLLVVEKLGRSKRSCYFCEQCQQLYDDQNA